MTAVQLSGLRKSFGSVDIIHSLDLSVAPGEFVVFVGPSGCGKSTLLRLIAGLETASGGTIRIGDEDVTDVPPARRGVAMVFQSYALFPHMSVSENISFGLRLAGVSSAEIERKVARVAETLQLTPLLGRRPKQLSGGQRQRVAIGRAIIRNPKVFLFDEPLSNLDAALRGQMRIEIARLHADLKVTMIYVTHDQVEAMTLADRIVVLNGGKIEQVGTPMELYTKPANRFVAGFIGSPKMNFLNAVAISTATGSSVVRVNETEMILPRTIPTSGNRRVTLGFRPEDLSPDPKLGQAVGCGRLVIQERLGGETLAYFNIAGGSDLVVVKCARSEELQQGGEVTLYADAGAVHVFVESGEVIE